jgi:1,4-dihydroxy-2-naphthoate octaprenyltransferase
MRMDLSSILLLAAVALFVLAAFSINLGSIGLTALGLACFAASFLFTRGGLSLRM